MVACITRIHIIACMIEREHVIAWGVKQRMRRDVA
jgi:hypothetical protein